MKKSDFEKFTAPLKINLKITESASKYYKLHCEIIAFIRFTESTAHSLDDLAQFTFPLVTDNWEYLKDKTDFTFDAEDIEAQKMLTELLGNKEKFRNEKRLFDEFLISMVFTKAVDNFLSYLADLLTEIFKHRPETLKPSGDTKKVDWILSFDSLDNLISAIAEDKVLTLSHKGLGEIEKYLNENFKVKIFDDKEMFKRVALLIEYRNLIVHNRGIINSLSKKKNDLIKNPAGEHVDLNWEYLGKALHFLSVCVTHADGNLVDKFKLPTPITAQDFMNDSGRNLYFEVDDNG